MQYILINQLSKELHEDKDGNVILFDSLEQAMSIMTQMSQKVIFNGIQVGGGNWQIIEYIPSLYVDYKFINFNEIQKERK